MAAMLTSLMRGMLGVAASVLVVALAWTVYIKRDAVVAAVGPVVALLVPDAAQERPSPQPAQAATAPDAPHAPDASPAQGQPAAADGGAPAR